jgi:hypothetical protein
VLKKGLGKLVLGGEDILYSLIFILLKNGFRKIVLGGESLFTKKITYPTPIGKPTPTPSTSFSIF